MGINISVLGFFFLLLVWCLFLGWGELWTWPGAPASLGTLVFVGPASSCLPLLFPSPSGLEATRLGAGKGLVSEQGGEAEKGDPSLWPPSSGMLGKGL